MVRPANPSPDKAETAAAVSANTGIPRYRPSRANGNPEPPSLNRFSDTHALSVPHS